MLRSHGVWRIWQLVGGMMRNIVNCAAENDLDKGRKELRDASELQS